VPLHVPHKHQYGEQDIGQSHKNFIPIVRFCFEFPAAEAAFGCIFHNCQVLKAFQPFERKCRTPTKEFQDAAISLVHNIQANPTPNAAGNRDRRVPVQTKLPSDWLAPRHTRSPRQPVLIQRDFPLAEGLGKEKRVRGDKD
jgi:hypothetical protein